MKTTALLLLVLFALVPLAAESQGLPKKIRGYKVYDPGITVSYNAGIASEDANIVVKLGEPAITDIGLSGATIEIGAEFTSLRHAGKVDLVTFHDVRINGVPVDVDDLTHPFEFKKDRLVSLPTPARIHLPLTSIARTAYNELSNSAGQFTVTGTAFVFGRFRKHGFSFKRVVPVTMMLTLKDPVSTLAS